MVYKSRPLLIQPEDQTIKLIALTREQVAIVDADRYDWIMQWNWHAYYNPSTKTYYVARNEREGKSQRTIFLHRQLLGEPEGLVDHWDGDTLNCRITNLRACTNSQNGANRRMQSNNTSGYPGVSWYKASGSWRAQIVVNGRTMHLGYFEFQSDAVTARELAEDEYFGEFAHAKRPCNSVRPREGRAACVQAQSA